MIKKCIVCNKDFIVKRGREKTSKYCSRKCYWIDKIGKKFPKDKYPNYGMTGKQAWNKGIHIKLSNSLENWKKNGGVVWNKGMHGFMAREKNNNWKNGISINEQGYVFINNRNHPYHTQRGYVREHRLVAERYLGRYLTRQEVVHHINGIKDDNRPENLYLFENERQHRKFHRQPVDLKSNLI